MNILTKIPMNIFTKIPMNILTTLSFQIQQQQLMGHFGGGGDKSDETDLPSVRTQVQRMEAAKGIIPPAPSIPAPQPPIRPPNMPAPIPSHPPPPPMMKDLKAQDSQEMPTFYQKRHERDTFGIHQQQQNWNGSEVSKDTYDSWVRRVK